MQFFYHIRIISFSDRILCHQLIKSCLYSQDEVPAVQYLYIFQGCDKSKVFCHFSAFDSVKSCFFQFSRKINKCCISIQLSPLSESTCPCKNRCNGVCGSFFSLEMTVVMSLYCSVSSLVLEISLRRYQTDVIIAREPNAEETISLITSPS